MRISRKSKVTLCLLAAALVAAAGLWYLYGTREGITFLPPCLFLHFTGLYCAGCGTTRALWHLLHGHLYAAFRMNPLFLVSLPFLAWLLIASAVTWWRGKPLPNIPVWVPWVIVVAVVLFTVARNLPWQPFMWLAPTAIPWVRG